MRRTAGFLVVAVLAALTACTGGTPDDSKGKSDDSGAAKTEPVEFGSKPVWTAGADSDDDQPDKRSGIEGITDVQVAGDHVVLVGWDEDGDLNHQDRDGLIALLVLDAETGEQVWWISQRDPLPEDKSMTVTGIGHDIDSKATITESGSIVISYEKRNKETGEYETGVATLAIDSGKPLLTSAVAGKHASIGDEVNVIDGVVGDEVLVQVDYGSLISRDDEDERDRAMVLNVDTGKKVWSRDDMNAAAITEDVLLLTTPDEDSENSTYHAVDRDSDKTLWKSDELEKGGFDVYSFTSEVTVASTEDESVVIDTATGKELDTLSVPVGPCVNGTSLIACQVNPQGFVSISVDGKSTRFSKMRPAPNAGVTAVSNWIFTSQEGKKNGTYMAMDAAGNKVDTPGMVADLDKKLAITYTGIMGIHPGTMGGENAASEISAYKISG